MLMYAREHNFYELTEKYLVSNDLVDEYSSKQYLKKITQKLAIESGLDDTESYCRKMWFLPFRDFLFQLKRIILAIRPLRLFSPDSMTEALNRSTIIQILDYSHRDKDDLSNSTTNLLKKILLTDEYSMDLPSAVPFYVLSVEPCSGEFVYTMAMKLKNILPGQFVIKIISLESDKKYLEEALSANLTREKIKNIPEDIKQKYIKKHDEMFKIDENIRNLTRFVEFDVFRSFLNLKNFERYYLILANTLPHLYSKNIVSAIVERIIPYLKPGGLLLVPLQKYEHPPEIMGLELIDSNNVYYYKRTREDFKKLQEQEITRKCDSLENQLLFIKALLLNNNNDQAMELTEQILKNNKTHIYAHYLKGDIAALNGQFDLAFNQYQKVLRINPKLLPAYVNSAVLSALKNNREEAGQFLNQAERLLSHFSLKLEQTFSISIEDFYGVLKTLRNLVETNEPINITEIIEHFEKSRGRLRHLAYKPKGIKRKIELLAAKGKKRDTSSLLNNLISNSSKTKPNKIYKEVNLEELGLISTVSAAPKTFLISKKEKTANLSDTTLDLLNQVEQKLQAEPPELFLDYIKKTQNENPGLFILEIIKKAYLKGRSQPEQQHNKIKHKIERILNILEDGNLLEASMEFQELIRNRAKIETLNSHQKKRLMCMKQNIEEAIARSETKLKKYKNFYTKYYINPLDGFHPQLWEILSNLFPSDKLRQAGKKYGLRPDELPGHLK